MWHIQHDRWHMWVHRGLHPVQFLTTGCGFLFHQGFSLGCHLVKLNSLSISFDDKFSIFFAEYVHMQVSIPVRGTRHFRLTPISLPLQTHCSYGEYNLLAWHKSHGLGSKVSPTRPNKYRNYRRWLTDTSLPFNFCVCTQASYIYLSNSILIGWTNGRKVKGLQRLVRTYPMFISSGTVRCFGRP